MDKINIDSKGNQDDYYKSIKEVFELDKMAKKAKEIYNKQKNEYIKNNKDIEYDKNKNIKENNTNIDINNNIDNNKKDGNKNANIPEIKDYNIENVLD